MVLVRLHWLKRVWNGSPNDFPFVKEISSDLHLLGKKERMSVAVIDNDIILHAFISCLLFIATIK